MRKNLLIVGVAGMCALMLATVVGCGRDQTKKSYKGPFEGTALKIDPETNEVSMKMVHPEQGLTVTVKGYVNDKTLVEINGMTARVEDVRPGDHVKVTGYNETVGSTKHFIVTNISVRRADNGWVKVGQGHAPATATATQAAH